MLFWQGLEWEITSLKRKNHDIEETLDKLRDKYVVLREKYDRLKNSSKIADVTSGKYYNSLVAWTFFTKV